jgi:hypothetical protein
LHALCITARDPIARHNAPFIIAMEAQQLPFQILILLTLEDSLLASKQLQLPSSLLSMMLLEPFVRTK